MDLGPEPGDPVRRLLAGTVLALLLTLFLALLVLPLAGLVLRIPLGSLGARLTDPAILAALRLSVITSVAATLLVIVLGLPAAYLLATRSFPGKRWVELAVELPMVLPPTVAGLALLLAFGRSGLAGHALSFFGLELPFTTLGVIVAQAFMASPFFVTAARAGIAGVDRPMVEAAATLRAGEWHRFFHVILPLALPSLGAGAIMTMARALGEFGATITFAGNLPGVTQTMPLAVYLAFQYDLDAAVTLAVLLMVLSAGLLYVVRRLGGTLARSAPRLPV